MIYFFGVYKLNCIIRSGNTNVGAIPCDCPIGMYSLGGQTRVSAPKVILMSACESASV